MSKTPNKINGSLGMRYLSNEEKLTGVNVKASLDKFQSMSNFDKLYNKRIDWKPIVAANKEKFL